MQSQIKSGNENKNKNKPISVGDYEITKNESNDIIYNYGFFSNVLEDENKAVKIT